MPSFRDDQEKLHAGEQWAEMVHGYWRAAETAPVPISDTLLFQMDLVGKTSLYLRGLRLASDRRVVDGVTMQATFIEPVIPILEPQAPRQQG